jgi:hypothetical protein
MMSVLEKFMARLNKKETLDLFDNPVGCLTVFAVFQAKALQNRVF